MKSYELFLSCAALLSAWVFVLVCWFIDRSAGTDLFARAGSVLVLVAVIAEYRLLASKNAFHSLQLTALENGHKVDFGIQHPNKRHLWLEGSAHISTIVGTLIWGYGDLIIARWP